MKRKRPGSKTQAAIKKQKTDEPDTRSCLALLRLYYPHVVTLREFLATELPKRRRKELLRFGPRSSELCPEDPKVISLLDQTIVGSFSPVSVSRSRDYDIDISTFIEQLSEVSIHTSLTQGTPRQTEIVDFVLWSVFRRSPGGLRPTNILSLGYQRGPTRYSVSEAVAVPGVPELYSTSTNVHVETLRRYPWTGIPPLLGRHAERILAKLFIECGVFTQVADTSSLLQTSGPPLSELRPIKIVPTLPQTSNPGITSIQSTVPSKKSCLSRTLTTIRLVRHRMLYARPSINARGDISFGLGPSHVFNRCRNTNDHQESLTIAKYMFPRQFGLHNVFTSDVNPTETAQPFKDYTLRDKEIARLSQHQRRRRAGKEPLFPKRMQGNALDLVQRTRKRHTRCPYHALLSYYCPVETTKPVHATSAELASSPAQVSAFCRAIVARVLPQALWGQEENGKRNLKRVMHNIDHFIRLRRFESMSMHELMQGIQLKGVAWLAAPQKHENANLSISDFRKRSELMAELLYYLFDSFLIPLIRSNFHVTESHAHRNQIAFYRHDVWKALSEPALAELKINMLEECSTAQVRKLLARRALGVSRVRLLPKKSGMRPIINLRRRVQMLQGGRLVLGKSINSLLTPAFSVLNHEKSINPDMLGSALFSVDNIFPRLQAFRESLTQHGKPVAPLYFAKVDVQAAFDTIPQQRMLQVVKTILRSDQYWTQRYAKATLNGDCEDGQPGFGAKASWKFLTRAENNINSFDLKTEVVADAAEGRSRKVYVDGVVRKLENRRTLLNLVEEHVGSNLLKLGKRYYRQKHGIPQGSIVSSLLCSYLYAELEREVLDFVASDQESILLRLIDDFLVISTSQSIAETFMRTMHRGAPAYGVRVKHEKSLTNFDIAIDGHAVARLPAAADFPYCGNAINTTTLDMSQDRDRRRQTNLADSVTVEYSKLPGQSFYRKMVNSAKLQMRAMLLSTSFNSILTVYSNLYHSFWEVAQKSLYYIRSLPSRSQPTDNLMIRTVGDVIKLVSVLMKRRRKSCKGLLSYECAVTPAQSRWLACTAFLAVYQRRQTGHRGLVQWLQSQLQSPALRAQEIVLRPVASQQRQR